MSVIAFKLSAIKLVYNASKRVSRLCDVSKALMAFLMFTPPILRHNADNAFRGVVVFASLAVLVMRSKMSVQAFMVTRARKSVTAFTLNDSLTIVRFRFVAPAKSIAIT
jgi:hypothetical protein